MPKPTKNYPSAAPLPFLEPVKAPAPAKMEVKLFASTVERVASAVVEGQEDQSSGKRRFQEAADDSDEDEEGGNEASSSTASALQRKQQALLKAEKRSAQEDKRRKKAKKKRKRRDSSGSDEDKPASNDESQEDELRVKGPSGPSEIEKKKARDGGISWNVMHVENVRGKVSNANKGFTDADLERRFGPRETVSSGSLMTEQEVMAMLRKDKKGKSDSDWAMRRAQKELAEWTEIKAQRMARSGEEKERLVVSGRGSKIA